MSLVSGVFFNRLKIAASRIVHPDYLKRPSSVLEIPNKRQKISGVAKGTFGYLPQIILIQNQENPNGIKQTIEEQNNIIRVQEETIESQEKSTRIQTETIQIQEETIQIQEETTRIQEETIDEQMKYVKALKERIKLQKERIVDQNRRIKSLSKQIRRFKERSPTEDQKTPLKDYSSMSNQKRKRTDSTRTLKNDSSRDPK